MSRRFESCWGWLLVAVCAPLLASAAPAAPPPLAPSPAAPVSADRSAQRAQFLLAYAAAKLGGSAWRTLASGLADYPLYPYLEAAALSHDLAHADGKAVEAYIARYPGLIPARDLRRDYLHRLAGAAQWDDFRRLYRPDLGLALACRDLQARLAAGQTLDFARDYSTLWKADDWPAACKPALEWARDHQLLTRQRLWQRVERLASEGSASAIEDTARWMRTTDAAVAKRIALARRSPMTALRHASGWKSDAHTRLAVALALQRLARQDEQAAQRNWDKLQPRFTFTPTQNHAIQAAIALYAATSYAPDAARKLDALPAAATTDTTREWRVRLALVAGDWRKVLDALDALSAEQQSDEVWRYWRARALAERGQDAASRAAFATIAGNADFYGFLAADWLGQPYVICADQLVGSVAEDATLLRVAPLDRAFELKAIGLEAPARREWAQAMGELDADQQRLAADLATRRGWYSRAIVTLNSGTNRRLYDLRYPLAYRQAMEGNATTAGIEPAWAFAIARAESAWIPDARSGANARGLMQLLPATAREVAKRDNLPYRHAADLYDPAINIPLGTHYLARMAARYQGAPWLASAAYNAGAGNVGRWLDARGTLAPDVFVASIPFNETRAYVRRVMAYTVIYDWRLHGAAEPLSARMPRIGEAYAPSDTNTPRKAVTCPAPVPASASSSATTAGG